MQKQIDENLDEIEVPLKSQSFQTFSLEQNIHTFTWNSRCISDTDNTTFYEILVSSVLFVSSYCDKHSFKIVIIIYHLNFADEDITWVT